MLFRSEQPRVQNLLDLVFFGVINQIGRWALVIGAMGYCFPVRREKINMEHWVDAPLRGKFKMVIDRGHHLNDFKWSVASCREFGHRLGGTEIFAF